MYVRLSSVFIFAMAIGLLLPSGLGVNIGFVVNASKVSLLLVVCIWGIVLFSNKKFFYFKSIDLIILGFITWLFVGSVITGMFNLGGVRGVLALIIATLVWVLSYFLYYFMGRLFRDEYKIFYVLKSLLYILVVCAVVAVLESIFQTNFYGAVGKMLGLIDAGSGKEMWRGGMYRARASLDQPIAFGFGMVIGYILVDYLARVQRLSRGRFLKTLFILALFLSLSRSAILVGLICIIAINYSKIGVMAKFILMLLLAASVVWLITNLDTLFYVDDSLLAGADTAVGQTGNLIGRFRDIEFVVSTLNFSPFFGLGIGLLHNDVMFSMHYPLLFDYYDRALDNMVLAILVEAGLTGFLMASFALVAFSLYCYQLPACAEKRFLGLMLFIFISASLSYDLLVFPGVGRLMLVLFGLIVSVIELNKRKARLNRMELNLLAQGVKIFEK